MSRVTLCDSGVGNLSSVRAACERLGCTTETTRDPARIRDAEAVVLPGVGSFSAVEDLARGGLGDALRERAEADRPLLGICLGLQLLTEGSDEVPGRPGLGVIPGRCRALPPRVRTPHLGWNDVVADPGARVLRSGVAAFANGYALTTAPAGCSPRVCQGSAACRICSATPSMTCSPATGSEPGGHEPPVREVRLAAEYHLDAFSDD